MWDTRTGSAFLELDRLLPEQHQSSQLRGHFPHPDTPTNSLFVSGSRLSHARAFPATATPTSAHASTSSVVAAVLAGNFGWRYVPSLTSATSLIRSLCPARW